MPGPGPPASYALRRLIEPASLASDADPWLISFVDADITGLGAQTDARPVRSARADLAGGAAAHA